MSPNELNLSEVLVGLKDKKFSSGELIKACFERIEQKDPIIKAFLALPKEQALTEAKKADETIKKLGAEKAFEKFPLLGVPYACKDNFNTEGIETTASSAILKGYIPPYESTVTTKLKTAGAVLIGKTNMDAFAHGSSTETSDYQITVNPWDFSRVAGGSSGGSAAAVILDMCIFAIGSETSGSIRAPSAWCSVTGLKPTYGRVSRYGVIAMASSTDSPGPICKTAEDCGIILEILAGHDPNDSTSSVTKLDKYRPKSKADNLKRIKIGVPTSYLNIDLEPEVKKTTKALISQLENFGAEIVEMDLLDPIYSIAVYTIIQRSEVSSNLARFDGIRYGHDRSSFGFEARKRMMLGAYVLSAGYYDQYYAKAQRVRTLIVEDFANAFKKVDLIVGPTMPSIALNVGESADNAMFGELADVLINPSSIAGLPAISIPAGFSQGLPIGVQLIGPMFSEAKILQTAYNYQQVTNFHKLKPKNYDEQ